jgi:hypothetical protein
MNTTIENTNTVENSIDSLIIRITTLEDEVKQFKQNYKRSFEQHNDSAELPLAKKLKISLILSDDEKQTMTSQLTNVVDFINKTGESIKSNFKIHDDPPFIFWRYKNKYYAFLSSILLYIEIKSGIKLRQLLQLTVKKPSNSEWYEDSFQMTEIKEKFKIVILAKGEKGYYFNNKLCIIDSALFKILSIVNVFNNDEYMTNIIRRKIFLVELKNETENSIRAPLVELHKVVDLFGDKESYILYLETKLRKKMHSSCSTSSTSRSKVEFETITLPWREKVSDTYVEENKKLVIAEASFTE